MRGGDKVVPIHMTFQYIYTIPTKLKYTQLAKA